MDCLLTTGMNRYATHTSWKGDRDDELAKSLVARLKGAVRRLSCVDADDFYEEEYAEAADQAVYAAQEVVKHITSGWQFSWGLRVKLWQAYLSGIFDGLDEGIYIATKEKYLSRLQKYLAPKLEISPLLHKYVGERVSSLDWNMAFNFHALFF